MSRRTRLLPLAAVAVAVLAAGGVGAAAPQAPAGVIFSDNMENGPNGWTVSTERVGNATCVAEWRQTTEDSHSASRSWTNSPYAASGSGNCLNHLVSPPIVTPAGQPDLALTFWEHHWTEGGSICNPPENTPPCDYGQVWLITNKTGAKWTEISSRFEEGSLGDPWKEITIKLDSTVFTPGDTIQIRFTFSSDALVASPVFEGWYIDDVVLCTGTASCGAVPTAVAVASFGGSAIGRTEVGLNWRTASEVDLLGFNVWRFSGGKALKVNRALVAAKAAGGATRAADRPGERSARPGSACTSRPQEVRRDGTRGWRAGASVRTRR